MFDLIVIGGGPTGLCAAMYAARLELKTLLFGELMGGAVNFAHAVENYPGFESITGMELAERLKSHAAKYNVEFKEEKVNNLEQSGKFFKVHAGGAVYEAKSIIIATGGEVRKLGVPGEKEFDGKGVHYCVLCDGPLYPDKDVAIIGGSDAAAKEALLLAQYAKMVYVIHRGDRMKAEESNCKKLRSNPKIKILANTNVSEIKGDKLVKSVTLDRDYEGRKQLNVDAVFIYVGRLPASQLAKGIGVKLNEKGEIITDKESNTNVPGVFAAGDVTNSSFKQIIIDAGDGVKAAYSAYRYVKEQSIQHVS